MDGQAEECEAFRLEQSGCGVCCHQGCFYADCSASAERIKKGGCLGSFPVGRAFKIAAKRPVPVASVQQRGGHEFSHDGLCLTLAVSAVGKVPSTEIHVPAGQVPVHMEVEDDVRVFPVHIGTFSVEFLADSLDDGVLEPEGCKVAVADPAAVGHCLGDGERLGRVKPVLPGEPHGVIEQVVG